MRIIFKRLTASLLAVLLSSGALFLFTGCGSTPAEDSAREETTASDVSADTGTGTPEPAGPTFVLSSSVPYDVTVIRPQASGEIMDSLAAAFSDKLTELTGKEITSEEDSFQYGTADTCEILVGNTNRVATAKLNEQLAAHGGNCWGVFVDGSRLAVCGTGLPLTYRALDYVIAELLKDSENGSGELALEDGFLYIAEAGEEESGDAFELRALIDLGRGIRFRAVEKVASIPPYTGYRTMQGGGTDGKNAYYCMISEETPTTCRIIKFNTNGWNVTAVSEPLSAGHANDITYDPGNDCILISTCEDPHIAVVDAMSLTLNEYKQYTPNCAIEYCQKTGGFFFEQCTTLDDQPAFLTLTTDASLTETGRWYQGNNEHTCQGFCIDGDYLLCMRWVAMSDTHYITVHTLEGDYIGKMTFTGVAGEPENIFRLGDSYYVGCSMPSYVYRVVAVPDTWW